MTDSGILPLDQIVTPRDAALELERRFLSLEQRKQPLSRGRYPLVMGFEGRLLIQPGIGMDGHLDSVYELSRLDVSTIDAEAGEGLLIWQKPVGFNPGSKFVVVGEELLRASYKTIPSLPSPSRGGLKWSDPRVVVGDVFQPVSEVDDVLRRVMRELRQYAGIRV